MFKPEMTLSFGEKKLMPKKLIELILSACALGNMVTW